MLANLDKFWTELKFCFNAGSDYCEGFSSSGGRAIDGFGVLQK